MDYRLRAPLYGLVVLLSAAIAVWTWQMLDLGSTFRDKSLHPREGEDHV